MRRRAFGNEHSFSFTFGKTDHQHLDIMPWFQSDKENGGDIAKLENEKRHYENELRKRNDEVDLLKKEKARLEASIKVKEAIAAAKKQ